MTRADPAADIATARRLHPAAMILRRVGDAVVVFPGVEDARGHETTHGVPDGRWDMAGGVA